jgi:hypothetical protein
MRVLPVYSQGLKFRDLVKKILLHFIAGYNLKSALVDWADVSRHPVNIASRMVGE